MQCLTKPVCIPFIFRPVVL